MKRIAYVWATFFGSGLSPVAPGTAGSIASLPFLWYLAYQGFFPLVLFLLFVFVSGLYVSDVVSKDRNNNDPQLVVIDEVLGQGITLLPVAGTIQGVFSLNGWMLAIVALLSFRLFDVWKPVPVRTLERKFHGALGIMLDDFAAGIYGMIFVFFFSKTVSI